MRISNDPLLVQAVLGLMRAATCVYVFGFITLKKPFLASICWRMYLMCASISAYLAGIRLGLGSLDAFDVIAPAGDLFCAYVWSLIWKHYKE